MQRAKQLWSLRHHTCIFTEPVKQEEAEGKKWTRKTKRRPRLRCNPRKESNGNHLSCRYRNCQLENRSMCIRFKFLFNQPDSSLVQIYYSHKGIEIRLRIMSSSIAVQVILDSESLPVPFASFLWLSLRDCQLHHSLVYYSIYALLWSLVHTKSHDITKKTCICLKTLPNSTVHVKQQYD